MCEERWRFTRRLFLFENALVKGLLDQAPAAVTDRVFGSVDAMVSLLSGLAQKYLGKEIPTEVLAAAVRDEMLKNQAANPPRGSEA
jgi:hypothetical protein